MDLNQSLLLRKLSKVNLFFLFIFSNTFLWVYQFSFLSFGFIFNLFIFAWLFSYNKITITKNSFLIISLFLLHVVFTSIFFQCDSYYLIKSIGGCFYAIVLFLLLNYFSKTNDLIKNLLIISIIFLKIILFFLILQLILGNFFPISSYSAIGHLTPGVHWPFNEPSNVGNISIAFISFIFCFGRAKQIHHTSIIGVLILFLSFSLTFLIYSIALILLSKQIKYKFLILCILSILCFTNLEFISRRISFLLVDDFFNLSSHVFMQGYIDSIYYLFHTKIGIGFNNMGCLSDSFHNIYSEDIRNKTAIVTLNREDGSSILFKLISEFGILAIIFVATLLFKIYKNFFNKEFFYSYGIFSIIFLLVFCLRSSSYFTNIIVFIFILISLNFKATKV